MSDFDINEFVVPVTVAGSVSATTLAVPVISLPFNVEVLGVNLVAGTGPAGAAMIVQLTLDGSNAYQSSGTDLRPTIADGATSGSAVAPTLKNTLAAGKHLAVVVAQVGSGTAGSNLTVNIALRKY